MNGPLHPLPQLTVKDFGPTQGHVAEAFLGGKVFAILRRDDPALAILPHLQFPATDPYSYLFVHGGEVVTRFQNWTDNASHEIAASVIARLLEIEYGPSLMGAKVRVCACYGNLLRPGDAATAVQTLACELPHVSFEGYHGLVWLHINQFRIVLGSSVVWDATVGPIAVGPPGDWEPVGPKGDSWRTENV